jgi:CheY-like chemotaxis protein
LTEEKKSPNPQPQQRLSFHTLNNHLAACRGYAELLARVPGLPTEAMEFNQQLFRALGDALVSAMALERQAKENASEGSATVSTQTTSPREANTRSSSDEHPLACETLLLIEDDEAFREMLTHYLQRRGYTILSAQNGEEGLTYILQHLDEIDAVLLDRHMPRCDGLEFLAEMRRHAPRLRVVMISGNDLEHERAALEQHGVFSFLKKPFSLRVLSNTLRELFASPPPSTP